MNYPTYQQNDGEQQYHIAKESLKTAINMFERLRPDQRRRLLREFVREKDLDELWRRMQIFYSGQ